MVAGEVMTYRATFLGLSLAMAATATASEFQSHDMIVRQLLPLSEGQGSRRSVDLDIGFDFGSAKLTTEAEKQLVALCAALKAPELRQARFHVNGHTDAAGAADVNKALSLRRAKAVQAWLENSCDVGPGRLASFGWGEERPKDPLDPLADGNRRVEIETVGAAADEAPKATSVFQ